jgi:shikimate kinase
VLVDQGRVEEALPFLRKANTLVESPDMASSPARAMARVSLASALAKTGAHDEAAALMEGSYAIVLRTQGERSAVIRQARAAQAEIDRVRSAHR